MTLSNGSRSWCSSLPLEVHLRWLPHDAKAALQVDELVSEALEGLVVPLRVALLGVLAQEIEHGCERPEVVSPTDVELE